MSLYRLFFGKWNKTGKLAVEIGLRLALKVSGTHFGGTMADASALRHAHSTSALRLVIVCRE